jgi:hypothetical protein
MTTKELKPGTPLPWKVAHRGMDVDGPGGEAVAICHAGYGIANKDAAYIVHACNSYPALTAERDRLVEAILAVVNATRAYLRPDGIDAEECISRILEATDNPTINPIILEAENGRN